MMYHITPFVCFCSEPDALSTPHSSQQGKAAYLFALAHEEADGALEEPLETRGAEAEDVARNDEREAARERDDNLLGRAVRVIKVQCQEAYTNLLNNMRISILDAGLTDRRVEDLPGYLPLVDDLL